MTPTRPAAAQRHSPASGRRCVRAAAFFFLENKKGSMSSKPSMAIKLGDLLANPIPKGGKFFPVCGGRRGGGVAVRLDQNPVALHGLQGPGGPAGQQVHGGPEALRVHADDARHGEPVRLLPEHLHPKQQLHQAQGLLGAGGVEAGLDDERSVWPIGGGDRSHAERRGPQRWPF